VTRHRVTGANQRHLLAECAGAATAGLQWTVKADTLTAGSGHTVADAVNDAIRAAITRLVHHGEADFGAHTVWSTS
jgi:phosphoribosylamine-glycine ligase